MPTIAMPTHVIVKDDARALEIAVENLVENAIFHSAKGTAVELFVTADGSIIVADRGPGVAPEHRDLVFDRFWRAPSAKRPGAGLGLAIVRQVVDAHGGRVTVRDRAGGGSEFVIEFPKNVTA
ncbi:MAG: ATP-binding protein [Alphaproteobacteria bacterium]|nr:ATP-binding protein [Alphaproteobacteria bacterium]